MDYLTLEGGVKMPMVGYGVFQIDAKETERCVSDALAVGYRAIDTAQAYYNEEGVGAAVAKSGIPSSRRKSGSRTPVTRRQRRRLMRASGNSGPTTLTSFSFTSTTATTTARGARWRPP